MKKNVGQTDRFIRFILAVAFIVGGILLIQTLMWLAIVFFALAVIMVVTALTGICPLYMPFGINTNKSEDKPKP